MLESFHRKYTGTMPPMVKSERTSYEDMDGHQILTEIDRVYTRPWDNCIPFEQLSLENLPPFVRRLRDDQVDSLARFVKAGKIKTSRLKKHWPWDFYQNGNINIQRTKWGPVRESTAVLPPPEFIQIDLPPTYTSSWQTMKVLIPIGYSSCCKRQHAEEEPQPQPKRVKLSTEDSGPLANSQTHSDIYTKLVIQVDTLNTENKNLKTQMKAMEGKDSAASSEVASLKQTIKNQEAVIDIALRNEMKARTEVSMLKTQNIDLASTNAKITESEITLKDRLHESTKKITELEQRMVEALKTADKFQAYRKSVEKDAENHIALQATNKALESEIKTLQKEFVEEHQVLKKAERAVVKLGTDKSVLVGCLKRHAFSVGDALKAVNENLEEASAALVDLEQ